MCEIITSTEYRGYTIRQVRIRTEGGAINGSQEYRQTMHISPEYTQWQILQDDEFIDAATSDDDARQKIDGFHEYKSF